MSTKRLFIPDDVLSTPNVKRKENVRLLQYTSVSTEENFDVFLTHHALVYIYSGVKQIKIANADFNINPGEMFLIPRGEYVMSQYIAGENGFQSMMLFFNQKVARDVVDQIGERLPDDLIEHNKKKEAIKIIPHNKEVRDLFRSLEEYSKESNPFICEIVRLKFMELIYLLLDSQYRKVIISFLLDASRYEIPSISTILEHHLYSSTTIDELAKLSGKSLSGFKREFTQQYGDAPMKWIRKKKLERAAFLLETSSKSVEEISEACGFVSAAHFARLFKEMYLLTPTEFRTK